MSNLREKKDPLRIRLPYSKETLISYSEKSNKLEKQPLFKKIKFQPSKKIGRLFKKNYGMQELKMRELKSFWKI